MRESEAPMLSLTRIFFYINLVTLVSYVTPATRTVPVFDSSQETPPLSAAEALRETRSTRVDGASSTPNLDKDATIEQLRQALKNQEGRVATFETTLKTLSDKQAALLLENKRITDENSQLSADKLALQETVKASQANEVAASTQAALADKHKEDLAAQTAKIAELQQQLDSQAKALKDREDAHAEALKDQSAKFESFNQALKDENATLKAQTETALEGHEATIQEQERTKMQAAQLAQKQWLELEASITRAINEPLNVFEDAAMLLDEMTLSVDKQINGQRASWAMLASLRKDKTALEKQLAELKDVAAKVAALEKTAADAQASAKISADESTQKTTQITTLQDKIALSEKEIAQLKTMIEKLKISDVAPAHQLKAQLLSLQHFVEANLDTLMQQLTKAGIGLNSLAQRIEESRGFANTTDAISRGIKTLGEDLEEYFKQVTETLKTSGKQSGREKPEDTKMVDDLKEKIDGITAQYNSLAESANAQILGLQEQLRTQKETQTSGASSEIAELKAELQAQKERAAQKEELDRRFADAEKARQLDELKERQRNSSLETLKDAQTRDALSGAASRAADLRVTDLSIADTKHAAAQTTAIQGNIAAGSATSAALATAIARSGAQPSGSTSIPISNPTTISIGQQPFGQQPLSQFVSGMPQGQMMSKTQMMNGLPMQGQQMMGNLMGMPQFQNPGSMQQAQSTLSMIVQNNSKYRKYYNQAIQMILQPTIAVATRDRIESALQQAIKREGYYLYQFGQNGSPQSRQQAISLIQSLITDVQRPLVDLQQRLEAQGLGLVPPPGETIALLNGYLSNLTSLGGSPTMQSY